MNLLVLLLLHNSITCSTFSPVDSPTFGHTLVFAFSSALFSFIGSAPKSRKTNWKKCCWKEQNGENGARSPCLTVFYHPDWQFYHPSLKVFLRFEIVHFRILWEGNMTLVLFDFLLEQETSSDHFRTLKVSLFYSIQNLVLPFLSTFDSTSPRTSLGPS